jgi:hypothetical protein
VGLGIVIRSITDAERILVFSKGEIMRTQTISIYKFEELSDSSKEKARELHRLHLGEFDWSHESIDSIKTFCDHFFESTNKYKDL